MTIQIFGNTKSFNTKKVQMWFMKKCFVLLIFVCSLLFIGCASTSGNDENRGGNEIEATVDSVNWNPIENLSEIEGSWYCKYERTLPTEITKLDSECKITAENKIVCVKNANSSFDISFVCVEDFSDFMTSLSKKYKNSGFSDANPENLWALFKNYSFSDDVQEAQKYQIQSKTDFSNILDVTKINFANFLISDDKTQIQQTFDDGTVLIYSR